MGLGDELTIGVVLHFDVVMNMRGSTINYNGGSIADDEYAVWANGEKVLRGAMDKVPLTSRTINGLGF